LGGVVRSSRGGASLTSAALAAIFGPGWMEGTHNVGGEHPRLARIALGVAGTGVGIRSNRQCVAGGVAFGRRQADGRRRGFRHGAIMAQA